ncbi:MAG: hypothetical protein KAU21_08940 [Gammaproteobacteria bacterium]|nr:hypothetical protein [Gammaproteobacteria bacterium]
MFISNDLAFIELHKTGCTHIGKLLASLVDGVQRGKHNLPAPFVLNSNRYFLGSVRNPWDWYVSLWSYGCDKKGLVYSHTTRPLANNAQDHRPAKNPKKWKRCYADVHSASAFQDWLHMMNDKKYWNDFGEGYGVNPAASFSGLLSFRFLNLFCQDVPSKPASIDDLIAYEKQNCYINNFIRTEHLEDDLIKALENCKINLTEQQKQFIYAAGKTNTSASRNLTAHYYDKQTAELVYEREKIIIDKFSYVFPDK